MFVRRLKHPNGRVYIQVVQKVSGRYRVLKSFGGFNLAEEIDGAVRAARDWMVLQSGQQSIDFSEQRLQYTQMLDDVSGLYLVGIELLLGGIFDEIGFNQISDPLFRSLVLYRLIYPGSKLKTAEYLLRYEQKSVDENAIYRYMDKLHSSHKEIVQNIAFEHTTKILTENPQVVFYDVTTLHFEIDREDELRKTGFSKAGKHQNPQIVLGLLVAQSGIPLSYDIFQGNQFEGHTLIPVLNKFRSKYQLKKLTVVADAGLLSKSNIEALREQQQEFILGARIKNESSMIKEKILSLQLKDGESKLIDKDDLKLIINYSSKRAKKDIYNRNKGIKRLEKKIAKGKLTKTHINNRGYNKFLTIEGDVNVKIDYEKMEDDKKWDGLKGYVTNSSLPMEKLLENYHQLWQIERAFRVAKSELLIRPIFHRLQKRIEAHICLCFAAYKIYKELERQLKQKGAEISAQKAIEIAKSIYSIEITLPSNNEKIRKTLITNEEQKKLKLLFWPGC